MEMTSPPPRPTQSQLANEARLLDLAGADWKILVIDDEEDVHSVTEFVLTDFRFDGKPLAFMHAYSSIEAREILRQQPDIAVALVDVVMETDDAGLELLRYVREEMCNRSIRLILRTGQPGAAPERAIIEHYDINDYKTKAELSSLRLFAAIMVALRSYRDIVALDAQQRGLRRMLDVASSLYGARSVPQFAAAALRGIVVLLGISPDAVPSAFYADGLSGESMRDCVLAGLGGWEAAVERHSGPARPMHSFMTGTKACVFTDCEAIVRLDSKLGERQLVYVDLQRSVTALDRSLTELFQLKASSALENLLLLERNQTAQRQAVRALARLVPHGVAEPADAVMPSRLQDLEFIEFAKQLAVQAEVREWREDGARRHIERVGACARRLAELAGMTWAFCQAIGRAAELHDLGKLFVAPTAGAWFVSQPEDKTADAQHALAGHDFLSGLDSRPSSLLTLAMQIAKHHHEAWDGTGFPDGLAGEAIPAAARIVAIVDFFDTHCHRVDDCNGAKIPASEVRELIRTASGVYFDPRLARLFSEHWRDFVDLSAAVTRERY